MTVPLSSHQRREKGYPQEKKGSQNNWSWKIALENEHILYMSVTLGQIVEHLKPLNSSRELN
jgi:hypothetical protein